MYLDNSDMKTSTFLFIITLFMGLWTTNAQWVQKGNAIDGESPEDLSGAHLSISNDGNVIAIGAINSDDGGNNAGHVRIFEFSGSSWVQKGSDIDGEFMGDNSGCSVSLNADGSNVAIGAFKNGGNGNESGHVRVYYFYNGNWVRRGLDIDGEAADDYSGFSVSLSDNGNVVAIGAQGNDGNGMGAGHVRVYELNGATWVQRGNDIDGEAAGDESGRSISLNATGWLIAIGAMGNDDGGGQAGHTRVYQYNGTDWDQHGGDIDGDASMDWSGYSVGLAADGNTLVVGSLDHTNYGYTKVYTFDVSSWNWVQKGTTILGEAQGDKAGQFVSINADGNVVAIGSTSNDDNGNDAGHVRIFRYGTDWVQVGNDIDGENAGDLCGIMSLSSDGATVAVGSPGYDVFGGDSYAGRVRVFHNNFLGVEDNLVDSKLEVYPNPTNANLIVETINMEQIEIRDSKGNLILQKPTTRNKISLNMSLYSKGVYFIKVTASNSVQFSKVLVE